MINYENFIRKCIEVTKKINERNLINASCLSLMLLNLYTKHFFFEFYILHISRIEVGAMFFFSRLTSYIAAHMTDQLGREVCFILGGIC